MVERTRTSEFYKILYYNSVCVPACAYTNYLGSPDLAEYSPYTSVNLISTCGSTVQSEIHITSLFWRETERTLKL